MHFEHRVCFGIESLFQIVKCQPGIDIVAAGEKISRGVLIFRPCVNRQMALLDDNNAGDAPRRKMVKIRAYDRGVGLGRGADHGVFNISDIVQYIRIAGEKFDKNMPA